ncbi:MAG TPA: hypothetical protein VFP34_17720 [Microlunatus sp.]|nr:hypothetical protein [Microlunatus sp.]
MRAFGPDRPVGQLAVIVSAQVLALRTWFAASAAGPAIRAEWRLTEAQVPLLTVAVQLGFVVGALVSAALTLPGRLPAPRLMAAGALGAALCTAAVARPARGLSVTVALMALIGLCLAVVYRVGLKPASSWFVARRVGLFAIGPLPGALAMRKLIPLLSRPTAAATT